MASSKSRAALRFSIDDVCRSGECYLWTFTFAEVLDLREACARWSRLQKALVRDLGFYGVRVYELHPGGHGLHVHVVAGRRFPVVAVRLLAQSKGFGRIHVKRSPYESRHYVAKYVSKDTAEVAPCLRGRRLWACIGFKGSKVRDMESSYGVRLKAVMAVLRSADEKVLGAVASSRGANYRRFERAKCWERLCELADMCPEYGERIPPEIMAAWVYARDGFDAWCAAEPRPGIAPNLVIRETTAQDCGCSAVPEGVGLTLAINRTTAKVRADRQIEKSCSRDACRYDRSASSSPVTCRGDATERVAFVSFPSTEGVLAFGKAGGGG